MKRRLTKIDMIQLMKLLRMLGFFTSKEKNQIHFWFISNIQILKIGEEKILKIWGCM